MHRRLKKPSYDTIDYVQVVVRRNDEQSPVHTIVLGKLGDPDSVRRLIVGQQRSEVGGNSIKAVGKCFEVNVNSHARQDMDNLAYKVINHNPDDPEHLLGGFQPNVNYYAQKAVTPKYVSSPEHVTKGFSYDEWQKHNIKTAKITFTTDFSPDDAAMLVGKPFAETSTKSDDDIELVESYDTEEEDQEDYPEDGEYNPYSSAPNF